MSGHSETVDAVSNQTAPVRTVLVVAHTGRDEALSVAHSVVTRLLESGLGVRVEQEELADVRAWCAAHAVDPAALDAVTEVKADDPHAGEGCELAVVVGGDGTILRAAERTRATGTPLLGINLGHVGFLAEAEWDDAEGTLEAIIEGRYAVEERQTIDVTVACEGHEHFHGWALNEASVEKAARERMLEVMVEVDGRPLSRWGCDGVVCATPTGSTAYAFSAGGPVVWPQVEAFLLVPISAHALFARPMVVSPQSLLVLDVVRSSESGGVLWCDGRRTLELPPGARVTVTRGDDPIRLARLSDSPFTDRLVAKFDLPVSGWRGAADRREGRPRA